MPYSSIESRITIISNGNTAFGGQINSAMQAIYDGSPLAAAAIDAWLSAHPTQDLTIEYQPGVAFGGLGTGTVTIDPTFFNQLRYISVNGNVVQDTLISGLTHELGHAITGRQDNDSFSNLAGDNIDEVESWFLQLGLDPQASYNAYEYGATSELTVGSSLTTSDPIVNAIYDRGLYTNLGFSLELP